MPHGKKPWADLRKTLEWIAGLLKHVDAVERYFCLFDEASFASATDAVSCDARDVIAVRTSCLWEGRTFCGVLGVAPTGDGVCPLLRRDGLRVLRNSIAHEYGRAKPASRPDGEVVYSAKEHYTWLKDELPVVKQELETDLRRVGGWMVDFVAVEARQLRVEEVEEWKDGVFWLRQYGQMVRYILVHLPIKHREVGGATAAQQFNLDRPQDKPLQVRLEDFS